MPILLGIAAVIGSIIVIALLMTLPVWWAWNTFAPSVFGWSSIGFWQALALSILLSAMGSSSSSSGK